MATERVSLGRRGFLQAASASALGGPFAGRLAAAQPPNILVVITDQQFAGAMSNRLGRRYIHTPAMDSLAATGMVFPRAYCANPLCVPSRTSMFTGRYPAETGVQTNNTKPIDHRRFPLMGSLFRQAGYHTAFFGKWHMPFPESDPSTHGFEIVQRDKKKGDDGLGVMAAEFLRSNRREPFLMVASFLNPHNICQWARGEELPDGPIGSPPPPDQCPPLRSNAERQKDEPDCVTMMRQSYHNTTKFPVGNFDTAKWRQYIWAYYRMIEKVDALIGQVLKPLRDTGQENRTLVVFLADHGDCQGAHGWNQKTVFYEEAARVPFILSYKGVTRPGVSERLVHTGIDLIPTLCDYASIRVPEALPGLSLRDTANGGNSSDPREYLVVSHKMAEGGEVDGRIPMPEGRMVRSQRYKYCIHSEGRRRESLVDLRKDPGEMTNLAGDSGHREILARHRAMLAQWRAKVGDNFPV